MHLVDTLKNIEMAEIELEYLLADALYNSKAMYSESDIKNLVSSYRTAIMALEVAIVTLTESRKYKKKSKMASSMSGEKVAN